MKIKPSVVLAALAALQANRDSESSGSKSRCKMCGHTEKNPTGECHFCGVYRCSGCNLYHIGDPSKPCPGEGVDIP